MNEERRKKTGIPYNVEQVPAENMTSTCYKRIAIWDLQDKYEVYSNQWIPLSSDVDVIKRIYVAGQLDKLATGGAILHVTTEGRVSGKTHSSIVKFCARQGVVYFALNYVLYKCLSCEYVSVGERSFVGQWERLQQVYAGSRIYNSRFSWKKNEEEFSREGDTNSKVLRMKKRYLENSRLQSCLFLQSHFDTCDLFGNLKDTSLSHWAFPSVGIKEIDLYIDNDTPKDIVVAQDVGKNGFELFRMTGMRFDGFMRKTDFSCSSSCTALRRLSGSCGAIPIHGTTKTSRSIKTFRSDCRKKSSCSLRETTLKFTSYRRRWAPSAESWSL